MVTKGLPNLSEFLKGSNPNRSSEARSNHNKIVLLLADHLNKLGYSVKADHIYWPNGRPYEINGYRPDVTAKKSGSTFIFEVETCDTYCDDHTKSQLTAFSKSYHYNTYLILPSNCDCFIGDTILKAKLQFVTWKIRNINVRTCDPFTCTVNP